MNTYSDFFYMIPEAILVAVLVILFIADFVSAKSNCRKWFNPLACVLMLPVIIAPLLLTDEIHVFGDMYRNTYGVGIVKAILAAGTLIVFIQSKVWAEKSDKEGEFTCS